MKRLSAPALLLLSFFCLATATHAGEVCGDPFTKAGLKHGVSPKLLYAIAVRESGLRPYALNVDGEAVFPGNRDEAVRRAIAAKSNVDVGLMQVSYTIWKEQHGLTVSDLLNPYFNADVAARILRKLLDAHPFDFLRAIGRYHTGQDRLGRLYSRAVLKEWAQAGHRLRICWEETYREQPPPEARTSPEVEAVKRGA